MNDDFLIPTQQISNKDLQGLIDKGLIKIVGTDPLGRSIWQNTELGNLIADELEKENNMSSATDDLEDDEFDPDEIDLGLEKEDLENEED